MGQFNNSKTALTDVPVAGWRFQGAERRRDGVSLRCRRRLRYNPVEIVKRNIGVLFRPADAEGGEGFPRIKGGIPARTNSPVALAKVSIFTNERRLLADV